MRRKHATAGRRAAVEPLEGRSYLSMTLDVRAADGSKAAAVTQVGQTVDLLAYAVISGTTAGTNDAFLDAVGSFLSAKTATGGVAGNLAATLISTFDASGSNDGRQADLNGDGSIDVGSNSTTSTDDYFAARAGNVDYDGRVSGDTNSFLIATLTYTVTSLGTGAATDVNVRAAPSVGNSYSGVWVQDGDAHRSYTADGDLVVGSPVAITGPAVAPPTVRLTGTTGGTAGSYKNDGNTVAKATDGSLSSYFDAPTGSGAFVSVDLGSAKTVTQIGYAPRSGYASRMVGGVVQASNSATFASGVVTAYTVPAAPASGTLTKVTPSTSNAYRYWRYVGPTGSSCNIAEFELFGAGTAQRTGTTIGTAGSNKNDGNTIAKATDGNPSTFFDAPTADGNFVGLDLGSAQAVSVIEYAPRSGYASRMVGGKFQASDSADFGSGVATLYTVTAAPPSNALTTVTLSSAVTYRYYRYLSPSGSFGNVAEVQFFG